MLIRCLSASRPFRQQCRRRVRGATPDRRPNERAHSALQHPAAPPRRLLAVAENPKVRDAASAFTDQILVSVGAAAMQTFVATGRLFRRSSSCACAPSARTGLAAARLNPRGMAPPPRASHRSGTRKVASPTLRTGTPGRGERRPGRRRKRSEVRDRADGVRQVAPRSLTTPLRACGQRLADRVGYGQARSQRKRCVSSRGGMHGKT
jgi:hypothetical protein